MKKLMTLALITCAFHSQAAVETIFCSNKAPVYGDTNQGRSYSISGMAVVLDIVDGKSGNIYWVRNSFGLVDGNGTLHPKTATNPFKEQITAVAKKSDTNFYETFPAQTVTTTKYEIQLAANSKFAGTVYVSIDVNNGRETGKGKWDFPEMTQSESFGFCTKNVK
jgi:hypothetical protein